MARSFFVADYSQPELNIAEIGIDSDKVPHDGGWFFLQQQRIIGVPIQGVGSHVSHVLGPIAAGDRYCHR